MDDFTARLEGQLETEEGMRYRIYDDGTGLPVTRGSVIRGNLSAGAGINLSIPFDALELAFIEGRRIALMRERLAAFPWFADQDEARQVALADLAYNLGVGGLLNWPHFLSYMAVKDYPNAMLEIRKNTVWVNQVHPTRATRIEQMILTGQFPSLPAALTPSSAST